MNRGCLASFKSMSLLLTFLCGGAAQVLVAEGAGLIPYTCSQNGTISMLLYSNSKRFYPALQDFGAVGTRERKVATQAWKGITKDPLGIAVSWWKDDDSKGVSRWGKTLHRVDHNDYTIYFADVTRSGIFTIPVSEGVWVNADDIVGAYNKGSHKQIGSDGYRFYNNHWYYYFFLTVLMGSQKEPKDDFKNIIAKIKAYYGFGSGSSAGLGGQVGGAAQVSVDIKFYNSAEPYYQFTNFWDKNPINVKGVWWQASETFFQASKFAFGSQARNQFYSNMTPRQAFDIAQKNAASVRSDWHIKYDPSQNVPNLFYPSRPPALPDSYKKYIKSPTTFHNGTSKDMWNVVKKEWETTKVAVMYYIVKEKFSQHSDLKKLLLDTGEACLIENSDKDDYWGNNWQGTRQMYKPGLNMLGLVLMRVREELGGSTVSSGTKDLTSKLTTLTGSLDSLKTQLTTLSKKLVVLKNDL